MLIAAAFTASMMGLLAFALLVCVVAAILLRKRSPVALRTPLPNVGGSQAGFDILPCVTSSLALASPLAGLTPPSGHSSPDVVWAMGRGMSDFKCAKSVEITIERDKVWLEVDGVNVFRAYGVGIVQVDDRRVERA